MRASFPLRSCAAVLGLFACALPRVAAADRGPIHAYLAAQPAPAAISARAPTTLFVAASDAQRGVPSFAWATGASRLSPVGVTPEGAARAHLAAQAARYGVGDGALATLALVRVHDTGRGAIIVVLRQTIPQGPGGDGIELFHHDVKVMLDRQLGLVAISGAPHPAGGAKPKGAGFALSSADAVARAASDLYGVAVASAELAPALPKGKYARFDASAIAARVGARFRDAVRARPVYYPLPDRIVPAYFLEIDAVRGREQDAFAYVVAADDGRVLHREDLTHDEAFDYRVYAATDGDKRPFDGPLADFTPHPTGVPDGSYPASSSPSLVSMAGFNTNPDGAADPWLADGATETKGNNVDAYTDDDKPDGFSGGSDIRATTTSANTFDRTYDLSLGPQSSDDQRMAAVTSIFYTTNWLHDWWYDSGWNEAAGNAQQDNYGRGGEDGDPLQAQAQDGAPKARDNANMAPFSDGKPPRMQMYVWTGLGKASITFDGGIGKVRDGFADFGPVDYDLTGPVKIAVDGTAPTGDACEPIVSDLTGTIALVDRGTCSFQAKAVAAQTAGAVGVVIVDDKPNEKPFEMSGGGPGTVTIPAMMIGNADGVTIKDAIAGGATVNVNMTREQDPDRDGTIDNTVVAHEWGHYLHLRQVACHTNNCSGESEGWADFDALMMVIRGGDDYDGVFPLSQYSAVVDSQDPAYFGIRRYPYTTDMTKNPLTYKHTSQGVDLPAEVPISNELKGSPNVEAHNIGEVWASMLFESYVSLLKRHPYDEAHRLMGDYVEAGLVMAPTDPTFLEQRDAILAAARAKSQDDFLAMAAAFAKRGAGSCAVAPPRESTSNLPLVEGFTLSPNLMITSLTVEEAPEACDHDGYVDRGEHGVVHVKIANGGPIAADDATLEVLADTMYAVTNPNAKVSVPALGPYEEMELTFDIALKADTPVAVAYDVVATLDSASSCVHEQITRLGVHGNVDEAAQSSATDDVEELDTRWKITGKSGDAIWGREEIADAGHAWHGIDAGSPTDTALESPTLGVSVDEPFVMNFKHRYSFEASGKPVVDFDGGVVEVTIDDGVTWVDASTYGTVGYGGTIGGMGAHNVLMGRMGFVAQNAGWPAYDAETIAFGMSLAGKAVRVRFRVGSDDAQDAFGWELDDIGFAGITNTPFPSLALDEAACHGEIVGAGGGASGDELDPVTPTGGCACDVAGDDRPSLAGLALAAAVALGAARRRRTSDRGRPV